MSLDKYDKIYWRGYLVNRWTAAALEEWEDRMGSPLTMLQGSFRPYTSYSGSSHMGGGAADVWFSGRDANLATKVGRDVGFACWWRHPWQGPWDDHIHGILIGDESASNTAKWQVQQYKWGYNGLSGGGYDPQQYRPNPIKEFDYRKWEVDVPLTKDEIQKIAEAVWAHRISDPLSPNNPNDKISMEFAINRILNISDEIRDKTRNP
jgi:hypothetical protein